MHYHFVVNPAAGRGQALSLLDAVAADLEKGGETTSRHVTRAAGDACEHVSGLAADDADRLVVAGGDGTLREVVNAAHERLPWPVGMIPLGTANLVGRELRMPLRGRARTIAGRLRAARPWVVDMLAVRRPDGSTERAVANLGVGLDAEIVHAVSRVRSGGSGGYGRWVRPIWDSLRTFRFPRLRVTLDERVTYAAAACVVQNAHNYGGVFELASGAALDSGALDVMLVRARTNRDLFRILFGAWTRRIERFNDVKFVRAHKVRLRSRPSAPVQADGDPAGVTDLEVEHLPEALTLLRAP